MSHRLAALTAALVVSSLSPAPSGASSPAVPSPTVEILVNGTPRPAYPARGRTYVEALKGQEYEIRLRNPYPVRVAVALSVDGLNTIDAREGTAQDARKWVLGPYETVTISGWQTSHTQARRFEFTTEARSYGAALGKAQNLGVISAVFFREWPLVPMPVVSPSTKDDARNEVRRQAPAAPAAADASSAQAGAVARKTESEEYAATGMGRRTDHAVQQVWLDLEERPAASVALRYEFRPALVRLGILPPEVTHVDPLSRRERARGFTPGFCPEPPR